MINCCCSKRFIRRIMITVVENGREGCEDSFAHLVVLYWFYYYRCLFPLLSIFIFL
ncbi:uncharacterized protein DS421_8g228780 [Arachis hypogaea]|nr:uncharacterized protein DS421_8g228780 [Arachis hypogaea]